MEMEAPDKVGRTALDGCLNLLRQRTSHRYWPQTGVSSGTPTERTVSLFERPSFDVKSIV